MRLGSGPLGAQANVPPGFRPRRGALPRPARVGLLVVAALAATAGGSVMAGDTPHPHGGKCGEVRGTSQHSCRCSTVAECRRAIDWWRTQTHEARRQVRLARRQRFRTAYPRLREAAFLAGRAFGVDPWAMLRVARCESTSRGWERWVSARNGATAMGAWQWLDSTWRHSPFAALDRRNVFTEAVATAWLVSRDGWRQWVCQP